MQLYSIPASVHVTYNIIGKLDDVTSKNYKGTEIEENGADFALGQQIGDLTLDKNHKNAYKFTNIYYDNQDNPPYYPLDPDGNPEPDPEDNPKPDPVPEKDPDLEQNPDPEPKQEPEALPEGVVPTGDTNHPMPYVVMMIVGFFGMLFSRRKFD